MAKEKVVEVVEEVVTLPEPTAVTVHLDVDPNDPRRPRPDLEVEE